MVGVCVWVVCNPFSKFCVRLWWKAAEVEPGAVTAPAVSLPKLSSSKGNWNGMVTGTSPPNMPNGLREAVVTFGFVTDSGDVMSVNGAVFARRDAAADCTVAAVTGDPEADGCL